MLFPISFPKLLNEFVSQEELFPISFATLLNELVSEAQLFAISFAKLLNECVFGERPKIPKIPKRKKNTKRHNKQESIRKDTCPRNHAFGGLRNLRMPYFEFPPMTRNSRNE